MDIKATARLKSVLASTKEQAAPGSMIHESGKAKAEGSRLIVDTTDGVWEYVFMSKSGVREAVQALNGIQVTCTYRSKK